MSLAIQANSAMSKSSSVRLSAVMTRFLMVAGMAAGVDLSSKALASAVLSGGRVISLSERLGFLLVYNTGTTGGRSIGPYTWVFNMMVTVIAIALVVKIVQALAQVDRRSTLALALVTGGALGNLASMVFGPAGVADFIAVQITETSTIVMNVADLFLWGGALLLGPVVVQLLRAVRAEQREKALAKLAS